MAKTNFSLTKLSRLDIDNLKKLVKKVKGNQNKQYTLEANQSLSRVNPRTAKILLSRVENALEGSSRDLDIALSDSDSAVRLAAIINKNITLSQLEKACDDRDAKVRKAARHFLKERL